VLPPRSRSSFNSLKPRMFFRWMLEIYMCVRAAIAKRSMGTACHTGDVRTRRSGARSFRWTPDTGAPAVGTAQFVRPARGLAALSAERRAVLSPSYTALAARCLVLRSFTGRAARQACFARPLHHLHGCSPSGASVPAVPGNADPPVVIH
jgi:hypothetical protein